MNDLALPFPELVDRCYAAISDLLPAVECPLAHCFTPGPPASGFHLYCRSLSIPAGSLVVSEKHETEHPYTLSQGNVIVRSVDGIYHLNAPFNGVTQPGTERIVFAVTDAVWTTQHIVPDTLTDPEEIRRYLCAPTRHQPRLQTPATPLFNP